MGPSDETLRSPGVPERWQGLSAVDRAVLGAWLGRRGMEVVELHTDVPVGRIPDGVRAVSAGIPERQLEAMYALRIDALVRTPRERYVVECKAYANAHALGQVLAYRWMLERLAADWVGSAAVVCACGIDDELAGVYASLGVRCCCVGQVVGG